ncbi:hypothetical protein QBC35DRAFT_191594 [Podospora australis]|uniref:J domain-containing protein n=1 Tax=Podospora australis TaxID=1536484 RepID=A0AAN6WUP6_9PEZI|nr:hypothetical protein QBC35DRAFT_191594 [Podospora australis]
MSERERDRDRERRSRRSRRDREQPDHGDGASVRSSRRSNAAAPAPAPAPERPAPSAASLAPPQQHGRPASARFSLRDRFATTRSEIDFDFDDGSSYVQSLAASRGGGEGLMAEAAVVNHPSNPAATASGPLRRDYYELLCLEKRGSTLYPEEVKAALRRITLALAVDQQSEPLQGTAGFYLGLAQAAFEGLVDPSRRLGYDLSGASDPSVDVDEDDDVDEFLSVPAETSTYETRLHDQYQQLTRRDARPTTDLGLRLNARSLLTSQWGSWGPVDGGLEALDFAIQKSNTVPITGFGRSIEESLISIERFFTTEDDDKDEKGEKKVNRQVLDPEDRGPIHFPDPTITFTGSTHGLLDDPFKMAPLLLDRYQPPGPSLHSRRRMEQLISSRFLPVLSVAVRQELAWREQKAALLKGIVVEQEVEVLPHPSGTLRLGYSLNLPNTDKPLNIEVSARKLLTFRKDKPSFGVAASKQFSTGTMFLVADGGNWNLRPSKECTDLSKFEKVSNTFVPLLEAFRNPPTLEAGYAFGRHDVGLQAGQALTKPTQRGLSGLDCDFDENKSAAWTIATGFTPGNVATYLRCGKDFFSSYFSGSSKKKPRNNFRAEVELAGTAQKDFYMAFRALKRLGRFSKAGLEVGVSPSNLHLSFFYSRLGQRISLPFLVATRSRMLNPKLLFWSTIFPFVALAAWELYSQRRKKASQEVSKQKIQKEALQKYIARRREEADELTVILATGVEPRQQLERQRGGLVILSAKYGVKDAPFDEVADVTIAVAALVDGGRLVIPKGLRKGRLLGFWDPAPLSTKILKVRYLWRGKERTVEVQGREELSLP